MASVSRIARRWKTTESGSVIASDEGWRARTPPVVVFRALDEADAQAKAYAQAVVNPSDGHAIIVGYRLASRAPQSSDFAAWRVAGNANERDTSFGGTGALLVDFSGKTDAACCAALAPDGAVLMAGTVDLARIGDSGSLGLARFR